MSTFRGADQLEQNKSTIVLGDSHTECGLNDNIIENITNLSYSSDTYFWAGVYSFLVEIQ